jgi:hypothetical protein
MWEFRIVHTYRHGKDYYEVKKVYFNFEGIIQSVCDVTLVANTFANIATISAQIELALQKSVILNREGVYSIGNKHVSYS